MSASRAAFSHRLRSPEASDGQRFFSHGTGHSTGSRGSEFRQSLVARTFPDQSNHDPLLEGDAIEEFRLFLQKQGTSWKKMRSRRSWQPQEGRTVERDNRLGTPTDLRSWEGSPRKRAVSSVRVCGRASTLPPARRRRRSRRSTSWDHAT